MIASFLRLATIIGTLPNTISNGQTADAVPLMADLNWIVNQVNANAAQLSLTPQLANANTYTAVQSGVAATSAANFPIASQVQNSALTTLASVAGVNTITARIPGLAPSAYVAGQVFTFIPAGMNGGGGVTININSLGAAEVTKDGGVALASADLQTNKAYIIRYAGSVDGMASGFRALNAGFTVPAGTNQTVLGYLDSEASRTRFLSLGSGLSLLGAVMTLGSGSQASRGIVQMATQAEMEAGSSETVVPGVAVFQFHPGTAKAWGRIAANGAVIRSWPTGAAANNTGAGNYTVNPNVVFSSGNAYTAIVTPFDRDTSNRFSATIRTMNSTNFSLTIFNTAATDTNSEFNYELHGDV